MQRSQFYERPGRDEMARRHAAVRAMAAEAGLDALLVFGNQVAAHDIRHLTAWPPGWDSYLVVPATGMPRLFVPSENHLPNARDLADGFADVAWIGPDAVDTLRAAVEDLVGRTGAGCRLGVVGPIPHRQYELLAAALDGASIVDASQRFVALRLVKSAEEIERTRQAAALGDGAIRALVEEARPGMTEYELGSIVERSYRAAGGEHGICFLATTPMGHPTAVVPAQSWSSRRLERGDMILLELSVGVGGSTSQVLRTIAVGAEPPDEIRRLHDVADEAFAAIAAQIRPGTSAEALLEAASVIDRAGCTVVDDVVHGYGGGYLPPVLRTPATQRRPPPSLELAAGMMLVVQPNVVALDGSAGVQTGELLVVTEDGNARFHSLPLGLLTQPS